jgi:hypothetical protein
MLTIDLEPELETTLINLAEQEHISVNEIVNQFIKSCLQQKQLETKQKPELLTDIIKALPEFPSFSTFSGLLKDSPNFNGDPLEIQHRMRDEWN